MSAYSSVRGGQLQLKGKAGKQFKKKKRKREHSLGDSTLTSGELKHGLLMKPSESSSYIAMEVLHAPFLHGDGSHVGGQLSIGFIHFCPLT